MAGKKSIPRKRLIVILALLCLVIVILAVIIVRIVGGTGASIELAEEEMDSAHDIQPNAKCAMENDRFKLELDEETMAIRVTDKASGLEYLSGQDYTEGNNTWNGFCSSGISLEFYSGNTTMPSTVSVSNTEVVKEIAYYKDGFDANLNFRDYGFRMQLQVRLTDGGVNVRVPGGSIQEGNDYFLGAVWLYPMMGSTLPEEEEGYMVIPEGPGAIINLKDNEGKYKNPYSKRIYGENIGVDALDVNIYNEPVVTEPEEIRIPVFGMVYSEREGGFLGVASEGEYNAELVAYPNGVITPYNWIAIKFHIRDVYQKQTARSFGSPSYEEQGDIRDLGMEYLFVEGKEADYIGLANAYQDYLVKNGTLTAQEDDYEVKLDFFGADSEKWLIFDSIVPMTTVSDMEDILTDLMQESVTDILPVYIGWQEDGATLNYGSSDVGIESKLGSRGQLSNLAKELEEKGITLTLQQELLLANSSRLYNTTRDVVKGISQVIVHKPTYQRLFEEMYYQTPVRSKALIDGLEKQYGGKVNAVSISGISNTLFSYYSGGSVYTRGDCAAQHHSILENLGFEKVGMISPNVYLWDIVTQYYDIPMTTSDYDYIESEIPFLQTVLRGYVPYWAPYTNFQSNEEAFFLKLLEYGAYPSFLLTEESPIELRNTNSSYIYTSEYSLMRDKILAWDSKLKEALGQIEGAGIQEHRILDTDVVMTEYKNGICVYVNYSKEDYVYQDIVIPALSYVLAECAELE